MASRNWSRWLRNAAWGGVVIAGAGCSALRMVPPADVEATSDALEATERSSFTGAWVDESFRVGPYRVAKVDRDWDHASGWSAGLGADEEGGLGYGKESIRSAFAFEFEEPERTETLPASCKSLDTEKGLSLGKLGKFSSRDFNLRCTCGSGLSAVTLELGGEPNDPTGRIALRGANFEVTPVHETNASSTFDPAGFRVDQDGQPVAAVEVLRPGRIWLSKALLQEERRQLGCLLAGVMLYVQPSEH